MIRFKSFSFHGDKFYRKKVVLPLATSGLTYFRGINYDGVSLATGPDGKVKVEDARVSNGAGKTRLPQILQAFIFGKSPRGNFKKMITEDFEGSLHFEDTKTQTDWVFTYSLAENDWTILKNGSDFRPPSHKASDIQAFMQKQLGLSRDDWSYFIHINQESLRTLLRGKPAERRAYLEEFFNIDEFYSIKKDEYETLRKQLEEDILLKDKDQDSLRNVKEQLSRLPGREWLKHQLELIDDCHVYNKTKSTALYTRLVDISKHIDIWTKYQQLVLTYRSFDYKQKEFEYNELLTKKAELQQKVVTQRKLKTFVQETLWPHLEKESHYDSLPREPEEEEPDTTTISELESLHYQMSEKLKTKKALNAALESLPEAPDTELSSLETSLKETVTSKVEQEHHYKLVKQSKDGACFTCGQRLENILEGETSAKEKLEEIKQEIAMLVETEEVLRKEIQKHTTYAMATQKVDLLREKFEEFPTFGAKLSEVTEALSQLKSTQELWKEYKDKSRDYAKWLSLKGKYEAEASALGYPDELEVNYQEDYSKVVAKVENLNHTLSQAAELKNLTEQVLHLSSYQDLLVEREKVQEEINHYASSQARLSELTGEFKTQLQRKLELQEEEERLKDRLQGYDDLKSRYKLMETLEDFYSPSGFKLYELKQRSKLLIERANYWSQIFFQEPYEWSMSDDVDNLELYVRPVNIKGEEPYSTSLFSAGEGNRGSRVLLFSQLELIPPKKRSNLIFLDEIESGLDQAGMQSFSGVVIPKLKETFHDYSIILISHLSSLKTSDAIDHMWLAERRERQTILTVYPWYQRRLSL